MSFGAGPGRGRSPSPFDMGDGVDDRRKECRVRHYLGGNVSGGTQQVSHMKGTPKTQGSSHRAVAWRVW